ncbi:MAG: SPW repeat protein [Anaerolineae bacterium]
MNGMRFIPAYVHGILDYLGGALLLLAPNIFGFADYGGAAVWVPRVLGVAILGMALMTRYRVGLVRVIPMQTHLLVDYVASIFLAVSPFLFGFSDADGNVWLPHVVAGIGIFLLTLFTETYSDVETDTAQTTMRRAP